MSDKNQKHPQKKSPLEEAHILREQSRTACSDVLGSYTGTGADDDIPEQDADDL